jgi:uncharacterized protein YeeX (DUF496 family)
MVTRKEKKDGDTQVSPGQSPNLDDAKVSSLESVLDQSLKIPVESVSKDFKKTNMSEAEVAKVLETLAVKFDMEVHDVAIAVALLFLNGAASSNTPLTLHVDVNKTYIAKRDLLDAYKLVTDNLYIRRLAEAMAEFIGKYAEKNKLKGELANAIETTLRAESGESLSPVEAAWCSSFSQQLPNLKELSSERLVKLLAADYSRRFEQAKAKNAAKAANTKEVAASKGNKGKGKRPKK